MLRTHLGISIMAVLLFLPHVSHKISFLAIIFAATLIPDIDNAFSTAGNTKPGRVFQLFVKHRGLLHSLTFCVAVSLIFALFFPIAALPFFLGYSLHLFADSFTKEGIRPFWPLKRKTTWTMKTGGLEETSLFVFLVVADLIIFIIMFRTIL